MKIKKVIIFSCIFCFSLFIAFIFAISYKAYKIYTSPEFKEKVERGNLQACYARMIKISTALQAYSDDNEKWLPYCKTQNPLTLLRNKGYIKNKHCFACPNMSRKRCKEKLGKEEYDFIYIQGHCTDETAPVIIYIDKPNNHKDELNCIFSNLTVYYYKKEQLFEALLKGDSLYQIYLKEKEEIDRKYPGNQSGESQCHFR